MPRIVYDDAPMSAELRLIVDPNGTYAALARADGRIGPLAALRRPLLAAVVIGAVAALLSTRHVTPALMLSTTIVWSVVIVFQIAVALAMIAPGAYRTVGTSRALDLFFASHAPWSLWMLVIVIWHPSSADRTLNPVLLSMLVPAALTVRMIAAFFRQVMEMDLRDAVARTIVHQAITWTTLILLFAFAVAVPPRAIEWFS